MVDAVVQSYKPEPFYREEKYSDLWIKPLGKTVLKLNIRSCAEAHIALSMYFGVPEFNMYEVRIGADNGKKVRHNFVLNRQ